jgi:hypothetical protein
MRHITVTTRAEIRMVAVFIKANVLTGHALIVIGVSGSAWF